MLEARSPWTGPAARSWPATRSPRTSPRRGRPPSPRPGLLRRLRGEGEPDARLSSTPPTWAAAGTTSRAASPPDGAGSAYVAGRHRLGRFPHRGAADPGRAGRRLRRVRGEARPDVEPRLLHLPGREPGRHRRRHRPRRRSGTSTWQAPRTRRTSRPRGRPSSRRRRAGPRRSSPISGRAAAAYYTLTPCRVADTRNAAGPSGGPALGANTSPASFRCPACAGSRPRPRRSRST